MNNNEVLRPILFSNSKKISSTRRKEKYENKMIKVEATTSKSYKKVQILYKK